MKISIKLFFSYNGGSGHGSLDEEEAVNLGKFLKVCIEQLLKYIFLELLNKKNDKYCKRIYWITA